MIEATLQLENSLLPVINVKFPEDVHYVVLHGEETDA